MCRSSDRQRASPAQLEPLCGENGGGFRASNVDPKNVHCSQLCMREVKMAVPGGGCELPGVGGNAEIDLSACGRDTKVMFGCLETESCLQDETFPARGAPGITRQSVERRTAERSFR